MNAAGRIGDVNRAVRLLVTDNKQEAENIADYLCSVNRERQLIENEIFEQAVSLLSLIHISTRLKPRVLSQSIPSRFCLPIRTVLSAS